MKLRITTEPEDSAFDLRARAELALAFEATDPPPHLYRKAQPMLSRRGFQRSVLALRLVASGEKSGRLDTMLFDAAAQQERELDTALGVATTVLGPGVILLVGGLVLFIVLAILLPIFSLNTLVR